MEYSTVCHREYCRRETVSLYGELRRRRLDLTEVIRRQRDFERANTLFQTVQIGRAGNRDDPRLLREEPGERDLRGSRLLAGGQV